MSPKLAKFLHIYTASLFGLLFSRWHHTRANDVLWGLILSALSGLLTSYLLSKSQEQ